MSRQWSNDPESLADCLAPLGDEQRWELRRYWEQVIREEWLPSSRVPVRVVRLAELDERRERRRARRAVRLVASAVQVVRPAAGASGPEAA